VALALCTVAAGAAPVAGGQGHSMPDAVEAQVSMGFGDYRPATIQVLAGDTVTWRNDSARRHTVTDDGGAYDSGSIPVGTRFSRRFEHAGAFPYHCRLHPFIRGRVEANTLLIARPEEAAEAGTPFPLLGRAALAPGTPVAIEVDDGLGGGYRHATSTTIGPDGHFGAVVQPTRSSTYRAVAGGEESPAVPVLLLDRTISAQARRGRARTVVSVHVTPPDPGATVVLQLKLRERFGWWPVAHARLDRTSRARFVLRRRGPVWARVLLTLPDRATPLATSRHVRAGRLSR
jgi:plastocyanin